LCHRNSKYFYSLEKKEQSEDLPPVPKTFRSSKFSIPTFSACPVKLAKKRKEREK
jgi:hypothetical protein